MNEAEATPGEVQSQSRAQRARSIRMSRPRNSESRFNGFSIDPGAENEGLADRRIQPAFKGTIASACESMGLDNFIEMARLARTNDPRAERFMDAWDALDASEQQGWGTADAICKRAGLNPIELLGVITEAVYRYAMYTAQIKAALALPSIVQRCVDVALTDDGVADRRMLLLHCGFLPTPKGSQVAITQILHAPAAEEATVPAPVQEQVVRELVDRFNEARGLPPVPLAAPPEATWGEEDDGE
jgi:hypothetical protein